MQGKIRISVWWIILYRFYVEFMKLLEVRVRKKKK